MTTMTAHRDPGTDWSPAASASIVADLATDAMLARLVRDALRDLARHHEPYARVFQRCPGVRLSGEFNAGMVEKATGKGRDAMRDAYRKIKAATATEPGLDTNTLIDRVTSRENPRLKHLACLAEQRADAEDRAAVAALPTSHE